MAVNLVDPSQEYSPSNPWAITSYDDLKTVFVNDARYKYSGKIYARLINDIDCNNYGDDFEWKEIGISRTNGHDGDFDLNGHTIKNVMLAKGSSLFRGGFETNDINKALIHDGKILNVFSNEANSFAILSGFKNVSISMDMSSTVAAWFEYCLAQNCSIYMKCNKALSNRANTLIYVRYVDAIKNCDLYFDIGDLNGKALGNIYMNNANVFTNCRFRGKIRGKALVNGYPSLITSNTSISNCVINIDYEIPIGQATELFVNRGKSGLSVVNTDLITCKNGASPNPLYQDDETLIRCTDAEMKSAEQLVLKGFNVVKVGD